MSFFSGKGQEGLQKKENNEIEEESEEEGQLNSFDDEIDALVEEQEEVAIARQNRERQNREREEQPVGGEANAPRAGQDQPAQHQDIAPQAAPILRPEAAPQRQQGAGNAPLVLGRARANFQQPRRRADRDGPVPRYVPPPAGGAPPPVQVNQAPPPAAVPLDQLDDSLPQERRRWTINVISALGLDSKASRDRIAASTIATAARIDEVSFKPDQGQTCASALRNDAQAGDPPSYGAMIDALAQFENAPMPRGTNAVALLRAAVDLAGHAVGDRQDDDRCKQAAAELRKKLRPYDLRDQVLAMGPPVGWTPVQRMQASACKVELDLLSLDAPVAEPLDRANAGVNAAFWIKRKNAIGEAQRSFICKPKSQGAESDVDGVPVGGEVVREALAARAADLIAGQTGLSLAMPETHVVALDPSFLPPSGNRPAGQRVMASVQEVRPSQGSVFGARPATLAAIPSEQCQTMAIFDAITLNSDRHLNNVLLDQNELVPIDHGATFPDTSIPGARERLTQSLGTARNCLMRMPGTHEVLSIETRAKLRAIDPVALVKELANARDVVAQAAPAAVAGEAGPSDAALEMTRRAADFVRLAGHLDGISAASIQIAMGKQARILFDPATDKKTFEATAFEALLMARDEQNVVREASLLNNSQFAAMKTNLTKLGWNPMDRDTSPCRAISNDIGLQTKLLAFGIPFKVEEDGGEMPKPDKRKGDKLKQAIEEMGQEFNAVWSRNHNKNYSDDEAQLDLACWAELRKYPAEIEEMSNLGLYGDYRPSVLLKRVRAFKAARARLSIAEKQSGDGGLKQTKNALFALKVRNAQELINMLRGDAKANAVAGLKAAVKEGEPAVSTFCDQLYGRISDNFRAEITYNEQKGADAHDLGNWQFLMEAGKFLQLEAQMYRLGVKPRPDSF